MSGLLMGRVFELADLTVTEQRFAHAFADHANDDGSRRGTADDPGVDRRES